jgi:hypothetical protein
MADDGQLEELVEVDDGVSQFGPQRPSSTFRSALAVHHCAWTRWAPLVTRWLRCSMVMGFVLRGMAGSP